MANEQQHEHYWVITENTATCESAGRIYYECRNIGEPCNETYSEYVGPLGHSYKSDDICWRCDKYKYNISFSQTKTTAGTIIGHSFVTSESTIQAKFTLLMSKVSSKVYFRWELKDSNSKRIAGDMPMFSCSSSVGSVTVDLCSKSSLSTSSKYYLVVEDVNIL